MLVILGRIWFVVSETVVRWTRNEGPLLAASMAYYAALSFFPLLLVLISALGYALRFSGTQSAQDQLIQMIDHNTAPALAKSVSEILTEVKINASVGGPVSLLTLLFSAIGIFAQLDSAFGRLWHDETQRVHGAWAVVRDVLGNRLKAFLLLLGLGLLLLGLFFFGMVLSFIRDQTHELPLGDLGYRYAQIVGTMFVNAIVFATLYKVLPRPVVAWRHAMGGGVFVSIVWELGRQVLAYLIVRSNYGAYGVVGAFMAMMVWVYYASILLFLGAQMVQVLDHPRNGTPPALPDPPAEPVVPEAAAPDSAGPKSEVSAQPPVGQPAG
jgi:membrane protein